MPDATPSTTGSMAPSAAVEAWPPADSFLRFSDDRGERTVWYRCAEGRECYVWLSHLTPEQRARMGVPSDGPEPAQADALPAGIAGLLTMLEPVVEHACQHGYHEHGVPLVDSLRAAIAAALEERARAAENWGRHYQTAFELGQRERARADAAEARVRELEGCARAADEHLAVERAAIGDMQREAEQIVTIVAKAATALNTRGPLVLWENEDGVAWAWGRIPGEGEYGDGQADSLAEALELLAARQAGEVDRGS